jgi:O-succinylbenzoic acid--CoA ligase
MSELSIFAAAREAPLAVAIIEGEQSFTFAEVAEVCSARAAALQRQKTRLLALAPRADLESLLWLYAAFAAGVPLLLEHVRAAPAELCRARELTSAEPAPELGQYSDFVEHAIDPEATLAMIPTSGSTGTPRLVMLSRRAVLSSAAASASNLGWLPSDRWLCCLPLAHIGGLSIVIRTLVARRTLVLFEPPETGLLASSRELVRVLGATQSSLASLVPSILDKLLDTDFDALPALRAVLLGGAACSPELAARAHARRAPLITTYGSSELASQVTARPYAQRYEPVARQGLSVSSGRALPGIDVVVRDDHISVRSRALFSGYFGEEGPLLDAEGFFRTSDCGNLGETGELFVTGRADAMIVTGGENVDPVEVEAALRELGSIADACVLGLPSAEFGQVVAAVVVPSLPGVKLDRAELARGLDGRLARFKQPRRVLLIESLPRTPSGKVDRQACATLLSEHGTLASY